MRALRILFLLFLSISISIQSTAQLAGPGKFIARTYPYPAEYVSILLQAKTNNYSTPSESQKLLQSNFINALKYAGIWQLTDVLHVKATDGSPGFSDINWVNPSSNLSVRVNNPIFIRNVGYKTDGASYTNESFTPSSGVNFTQNSGELIVYEDDILTGDFVDGCSNSDFSTFLAYQALPSANNIGVLINAAAYPTISNSQFDASAGLYFMGRTNSSTVFAKKGNGTRVTASSTSVSPSTTSYTTGLRNQNGSTAKGHVRKNGIFWVGGLLTTQQEASFKSAWDSYLAGVSAEPSIPTLGTIYNQSSWTSGTLASDFTANGATPTVTSNQLVFSGGVGDFVHTLDLNTYTCLENWTITMQAKVGTVSGAHGFAIGIRSSNSSNSYDSFAWFEMDASGTAGQSWIVTQANGTSTFRGNTSAVAFSLNDVIEITYSRNGLLFTVSTRNVTTSSSSQTVSYTYPNGSPYLPNTGRFSIASVGGTFTVQSLSITSNEQTGAPFCAIGDSKTAMYNASVLGNRWSTKLGDYLNIGVTLAGASDKTGDVLNRVQEIINLNPKLVILAIGSNDVRFGVADATMKSNYASIVSQLTSAGIRVIHTTGFYETSGLDQSSLSAYIIANYSSQDIIDTLPVVLSLSDGTHPNDAGHLLIAQTIATSGKIIIK